MNILVLNGSPRPKGNTKHMNDAFCEGALSSGNKVEVIDVCRKKINGCVACEYCHTIGRKIHLNEKQQGARYPCCFNMFSF